jgi:hypothetical protein
MGKKKILEPNRNYTLVDNENNVTISQSTYTTRKLPYKDGYTEVTSTDMDLIGRYMQKACEYEVKTFAQNNSNDPNGVAKHSKKAMGYSNKIGESIDTIQATTLDRDNIGQSGLPITPDNMKTLKVSREVIDIVSKLPEDAKKEILEELKTEITAELTPKKRTFLQMAATLTHITR